MKVAYILLIFVAVGALAFAGSKYFAEEAAAPSEGGPDAFCGISTYGVCETDVECAAQGCSAQVCQSVSEDPIVTTCEWKDCYDAKAYGYECKCVANTCQWTNEN